MRYDYDEADTVTGCSGSYAKGRLTSMSDYYTGRTTFCYDQRGNVTVKRNSLYGGALNYAYTLADRLASVAYPNGDKVTYGYDTVGRASSVSYQPSGGGTTSVVDSVAYYPFGPVNLITFHNGRKLSKFYDQDYAIDKVISTAADGLLIDATPDVLGNLKTASSAVGASPPTRTFQYDPLYRLTGVTDASSASLESYTYNGTGDRLSKTLAGQSTQTYSYGTPLTSHRLQSVAGVSRTYDANGNTTGRGDNTLYTYSDANRLADVCQPLSCPSTTATHYGYFYNGLGQRSLKQTSSMHAFSSTSYAYDERGQLLYELAAAGGTEYLYLDGLPVSVVVGGQIYYVETDQLGTPREVAASTNNALRWKWDYFGTTFGETAPNQNPSGLGNFTFNLRFPGQYFDAETGNHYNYFRDYEPQTGRYTESDPIGLTGGINTYAYVKGQPLNLSDLTGQCAPGTKMKKCLEEIFGTSVSGIDVIEDPAFVRLHGMQSGATTRKNTIYISMSCDDFFGKPWYAFILHEYYHVVEQWNKGMTIPEYLLTAYWKEKDAREFGEKNAARLRDCLRCQQP